MFAFYNNITVMKWSDNCDIYAMSKLFSNSMTSAKHQVDGNVKEVPCTEIIDDYISFM